MESGNYKGHRIFGHAILQQVDILSPERYEAAELLPATQR
jgi:hypothetical protein